MEQVTEALRTALKRIRTEGGNEERNSFGSLLVCVEIADQALTRDSDALRRGHEGNN